MIFSFDVCTFLFYTQLFIDTNILSEKQIAFLRCIFKKVLSYMHLKAGNIHERKREEVDSVRYCVYFYVVSYSIFTKTKVSRFVCFLQKQ